MVPNEWIVLVPKGAITCSVAIPKSNEIGLLGWLPESECPYISDELPYTTVTVYRDTMGRFPPVECNGYVIMVREAP